jgi:hypothetical protein
MNVEDGALEQLKKQVMELTDGAIAYREGIRKINTLILDTLSPMKERVVKEGHPKYAPGEEKLVDFITKLVDILSETVSGVEEAQKDGRG